MREDQKEEKARQILQNFNSENWLIHVNVTKLPGWKQVDSYKTLRSKYLFPQLNEENFSQIYELTSSIHALKKGLKVAGNMRRQEVDKMEPDEIKTFEEYKDLLKRMNQDMKVYALELETAPKGYSEKENEGLLPPWPGKGVAFQIKCPPSNKSDTQPSNNRNPVIFLLENEEHNPLNCSDVFKRVGNMYCYKYVI